MKILQLGNGGGLNPRLINSAFLIDLYNDHSEYLLFDCGFNIMTRLMDLEDEDEHFHISKIAHVVISHNHADHVGSLETLIYWNFFKNGVKMDIYVPCKGLAKTVKDTRKILNAYKVIKAQTYNKLHRVKNGHSVLFHKGTESGVMTFVKGDHGAKKSVGMRITDGDRSFFISGDTKASTHIEKFLDPYFHTDIIFHDYSNWDDPSKNVHACATDFERIYSEDFQKSVTKYHTGSLEFNKEWQ